MANLFFKTSDEMFDAGYAHMAFNIMSDCYNWRYRDEKLKTLGAPFIVHSNIEPNLKLAAVADIRQHAIG